MTRTKTEESDRPTWCRHYDEWKRAYEEANALTTRNSDRTEDWSREDLARLAELTRTYGEAAGRMWDEAPESEDGPQRTSNASLRVYVGLRLLCCPGRCLTRWLR